MSLLWPGCQWKSLWNGELLKITVWCLRKNIQLQIYCIFYAIYKLVYTYLYPNLFPNHFQIVEKAVDSGHQFSLKNDFDRRRSYLR